MVMTIPKHVRVATKLLMTGNQIVIEHARLAFPQLGRRDDMELHFHSGGFSQLMGQMIQCGAEASSIQKSVAGNEDVKFEIVVGLIAFRRFEHTTFAAAITST